MLLSPFCILCVFSLAGVQGSSSPADQPERGAAEGGEVPPRVRPGGRPEALAGTGLLQGKPCRGEDAEPAAGAAGDSEAGGRFAAGAEESRLGSCPYTPTQ